MKKGFTLIELMIVVAIIAIIAAIAIPNLLRSRMAANETAAVAACKAYATAQNIYRRTDYNKDGVLEYAMTLAGDNSLYETSAGSGDLGLIDKSFAAAEGVPPTNYNGWAGPVATGSKSGYVFWANIVANAGDPANGVPQIDFDTAGPVQSNRTLGFGMWAMPTQYDGTGRNQFQISNEGVIYQGDNGTGGGNQGSPHAAPLFSLHTASSWVVSE